jgi:hypothetical protein
MGYPGPTWKLPARVYAVVPLFFCTTKKPSPVIATSVGTPVVSMLPGENVVAMLPDGCTGAHLNGIQSVSYWFMNVLAI